MIANVSALARSLIRQRQQGVQQGGPHIPSPQGPGFRWGGHRFEDPQAAVDWQNARGQHTTVEQFLANHPGLAALFGQRGVEAGGGAVGTVPGAGVRQGGGYLNPGAPPQGQVSPFGSPSLLGLPATMAATPKQVYPAPSAGSLQGYPTSGLLGGLNLRPVSMGQQIVRRRKRLGVQPL